MNPLFNRQPQQNSIQSFIQQYNQFRKTFTGDPEQIVKGLVSSGKITQDQLNQAIQIANQFKGII